MKKVLVVLSCMASLFVAGILHAENIRMDEIVVTATRSEEQRQNIPASVTIITKEDIINHLILFAFFYFQKLTEI